MNTIIKLSLLSLLLSFSLSAPLFGGFVEQVLDLNNTAISEPIELAKQDLITDKEYSQSSYNFYPLGVYTQVIEGGVDTKVLIAVQSKGNNNIELFDYVFGVDKEMKQGLKVKEEEDFEKVSNDEMVKAKLKNGLNRYYYSLKKHIGDFSIEQYYEHILYHMNFYVVEVEAGKKVENLVLMEREDKTFDIAAVLSMR